MAEREAGVLTKGLVVAFAAALLPSTAGFGALFGWLASRGPSPFAWDVAAVAATAFATAILAGFTGALAYTTSGDVRATWRLAEATIKDQQARDRPFVVLSVSRWAGMRRDGDTLYGELSVELFNAGLGPAVEIELRATHRDSRITAEPRVLPVLAPLERFELALAMKVAPTDGNEGSWVRAEDFVVTGVCSDRAGSAPPHETIQVKSAGPLPAPPW